MNGKEYLNLTKEQLQWREEIERCKNSFEYFYNNYCKRDGMSEYSEEAYQEYIENNKKQRFSRRVAMNNIFYPLTPSEAFKK